MDTGKELPVTTDCMHECLFHSLCFQLLEFIPEVKLIPSDLYVGDSTLLVRLGKKGIQYSCQCLQSVVTGGAG